MLIPLEHVLLTVQILIGLRLIASLRAWLWQLDQEAGAGQLSKARQLSSHEEKRDGSAVSSDGSNATAERLLELQNHSLPGPPHEWRTRPVMLRVASGVNSGQQVEFNLPSSVFPVETDLFEGKMYFRLRGCAHEPKDYFFGKQRRLSAVVQGRFKQPLVMGECYTGYEFNAPFKNVPAPFLIRAGLRFIRTLAPTLVEDVLGERPYFLNPLCQTIQVMSVSMPGSEPPMTEALQENNSKLGGVFAEKRCDRIRRKNYFAVRENAYFRSVSGLHHGVLRGQIRPRLLRPDAYWIQVQPEPLPGRAAAADHGQARRGPARRQLPLQRRDVARITRWAVEP
ncbi:hypothetical protein T492DRAFT_87212 [Pavlovales sp. CCMP2436]|nr:hypothetical protein T492DRAFT_87212 [Pavlovales sp. CCMP2436]